MRSAMLIHLIVLRVGALVRSVCTHMMCNVLLTYRSKQITVPTSSSVVSLHPHMAQGNYQMTSPIATAAVLYKQTNIHPEFFKINIVFDVSLHDVPDVLTTLCNDSFYHCLSGVARRPEIK